MPEPIKTITVVGSGYVGLTTAALLSNCGYKVYALEINPERLDVVKQGRSFFYEEGLDPLIKNALEEGSLIPTDSYDEAIPSSQVVFSCVGTPDNEDGSSNLTYVFDAASQAAQLMQPGTAFVQKSTVPVGTGEKVEQKFKEAGKTLSYISNPEFLREGTAIADSLWFDRIVVGSDPKTAAAVVVSLYKKIEENRDKLSQISGIKKPDNTTAEPLYISTSRNSAELIKVSANAFLALKISFANSIAKLAGQAGANVNEVMDAVGADKRIGRAFLNAGRGYGGGCFPKDVSGLIRSAEDYGVEMEIMNAVTQVNSSMPHYIIHKAEEALGESIEGKNIAVLGLAFKAGTSDVRRSHAIIIANTLAHKGAKVRAYDPEAMKEAKEDLGSNISLCSSSEEAIKDSSCIFIATDWPEFKNINMGKIAQLSKNTLIVDCMNCLDPETVRKAGLSYMGVGIA